MLRPGRAVQSTVCTSPREAWPTTCPSADVLELAAAGSLRVEHARVPLERAAEAWLTRRPRQVLVP